MTTPVVNTAEWLITAAMRDAGLIGKGQKPTGEDFADGLARLNDVINLWQTQGLKLFLNQDTSVVLTAGQADYTFGPAGTTVMTKPLRVVEAYYADQNGIRRPLMPLSWERYTKLSQVTQQGAINSYFVDKQVTQLAVKLWLVPDTTAATGSLHLVLQTQATNFVTISSVTAFPAEWSIALRWGLADELATGQPQAIMDRCAQRAKSFREALEDWDVEDAPTQFEPDSRGTNFVGSFR